MQLNRFVPIVGCADLRVAARALQNRRVEMFDCVHCNSPRDSEINRYCQNGLVGRRSSASRLRPMSWRMRSSSSHKSRCERARSRQRRSKPMDAGGLYCGQAVASHPAPGRVSFAVTLGSVLTVVLRRGRNGSIDCSLRRQNLLEYCSEWIRDNVRLLPRYNSDRTS